MVAKEISKQQRLYSEWKRLYVQLSGTAEDKLAAFGKPARGTVGQ